LRHLSGLERYEVPGSWTQRLRRLVLSSSEDDCILRLPAKRCKTSAAIEDASVIANARLTLGYVVVEVRSTASAMLRTARCTSAGISIARPHSRCVSPGHLLVASKPILPPRPLVGEAKSR
jgi:hypothetical protein